MKKFSKLIIVCLLIISLIFAGIKDTNASTNANTLSELRKELSALKQKKQNNDNAKKKTQSEINKSTESIKEAQNEILDNQSKIEQAKKDIVSLNDNIESTKEKIKNILKTQQLTENDNIYLEYVFKATSYEELVYRYAIVEQILSYNDEQIDQYNDLIQKNEQLQVDLSNREVELNQEISSLSDKIEDLGNDLASYSDITMDIQDEIDSTQELIDHYVSLGCGETQNLDECVSMRGDTSFIKPLPKGVITSYFGYRVDPITHTTKFHSGTDIGGNKEGTNVYAAANGIVGKIIRKASCGGNQVYIHHTINGVKYTSGYMHLLTINVSIGDPVTTNTVVGTVGGGAGTRSYDGCSTGAHLHFMIATGWYGSTYTSYNTYLAHLLDAKEILKLPNKGTYWYTRY